MNNKVELLGWYGGDRAIARAAWVSTNIDVETKTDEQIRDLIVNKLWNNSSGKPHKTPFERGIVEFNITCDQASHIHIIKHRHLSVNGESARYKELKEDKVYIPKDWNGVSCNLGEEMSETYPEYDWATALHSHSQMSNSLYHQCLEELTPILGRKRAKESARFFKTFNSQINLSVMTNMSCFHNFYTLRADTAAQDEIHEIAEEMYRLIGDIPGNPFKYTLEAFSLAGEKIKVVEKPEPPQTILHTRGTSPEAITTGLEQVIDRVEANDVLKEIFPNVVPTDLQLISYIIKARIKRLWANFMSRLT